MLEKSPILTTICGCEVCGFIFHIKKICAKYLIEIINFNRQQVILNFKNIQTTISLLSKKNLLFFLSLRLSDIEPKKKKKKRSRFRSSHSINLFRIMTYEPLICVFDGRKKKFQFIILKPTLTLYYRNIVQCR